MTDREKLAELIGSTEYGNGSLVGNNFQKGFIEKIASHLIDNGVTVQEWIPVTERLPECEWGTEVGNIEWINCGMVFAGCFGRGGSYRDAYFRTWTDGTEGIDAKDADFWRTIQIPEPPKEETE